MPERRAVLDMMDHRPVWAMPEWVPGALREVLPEDWELVVLDEPADGSGDGAARVSPAVLDAVRDAEVYFGYGMAPELLEAGAKLRWVHSGAAGVGSSLHDTMRSSDVVFTNSAGIHAPPMAESVLAMILHFGRGFDRALVNQRKGVWSTDPFYDAVTPPTELSRTTVGVVGYGGIGREIARRVCALGGRVVAVKRTTPAPAERVLSALAGGGDLSDRLTLLHGSEGLDEVLGRSDVVVVCAPETSETRGMIDASAFARMRRGALLVNVARGKLVDEGALLDALRSGRLRGAALDVFAREPVPEGHPLWSMENVLMTPHVSAVTPGYWDRETGLMVRNLARFLRGAPLTEWENVVDKQAGY